MSDSTPSLPATTTELPSKLGVSARASLVWGGGFTLFRDIAQFGVTLILVRLLTPADYGTAAFAQAVLGVFAVLSYQTFSGHALLARDPSKIDWQAHFTTAVVQNSILAGLVLVVAFALSFLERYHAPALPLAALSIVLIVEIPGTLRHRMLETAHDWKRFRLLLIFGTFLGLGSGLLIGLMGGGVWALIVQVPMLGLPAAIDLLLIQRFRPDWTWTWARWRETFSFGVDRIGAGIVGRGRVLNEQALLSSLYDLATLGIFGRATGLAMLIAGKFCSITMMSMTPVLTRAEAGSERFQRLAGLLLRGVVWTTLPASALLGLTAHDAIALFYGPQWENAAVLLPLAVLAIGLGAIVSALSSLLVANNGSREAMFLDIVAGLTGIAVAVTLIPFGVRDYLAGLSAHALIIALISLLILQRCSVVTAVSIIDAFMPAFVALMVGLAAAIVARQSLGTSDILVVRLFVDVIVFVTTYVVVLRLAFARTLVELLNVAPGGARIACALKMQRGF